MRAAILPSGCVGLLCCLCLIVGCGGGGGGGPSDTAASLTAEGWVLYESGDYEGAVGKFFGATQLDADYTDAYNGMGWSYGKLDSLVEAVTNFEMCISKGDVRPDPYAGKAPVCRDLDPPEFNEAISAASTALTKDSDFEFEHYEDFNWRDLRLIKAQCYFALKQYSQAKTEIDALGGNTVDPNDPEAVAAEIERLEDLYGG
jgi:tetratricopeptide (TPR) repeat protein